MATESVASVSMAATSMASKSALYQFLDDSAEARPQHPAVEEPGTASVSYQELAELSDSLRDRLIHLGVERGDRIGIYMRKSVDAVVAIFGILKTGAAYVPVDPGAPVSRNAFILGDCAVKAVIIESGYVDKFLAAREVGQDIPELFSIDSDLGERPIKQALEQAQAHDPAPGSATADPRLDDLAYILYTSGSTGKPKGVALSHRAAISFVDWCSDTFTPDSSDRFSSHAPFHFDLSILDIYLPLKHGATVVLVEEGIGKDPLRLAPFISENKITSWYSTPSILTFLAEYGNMTRYDYSHLRRVLFAGEVFPIKHLRRVKELLPEPGFYNLYGPTETNVCTYFEIPAKIPVEQMQPFPIGEACSHYQSLVVDEQGQPVRAGEEGELCVHGDGVMQGYWNLPDRTAAAFLVDSTGKQWYKTGDIVVEEAGGIYTFVGRRDRMVKKRGYRVELGEIEAGIYRHPAVKEVAVIALRDKDDGVVIKAFISHTGEQRPSLIEMKQFCMQVMPSYMVPDLFAFEASLPKTSTDKINYQELLRMSIA